MFQRKPSVEQMGRRRSLRASIDLEYLRKVEEEVSAEEEEGEEGKEAKEAMVRGAQRQIVRTEKCGKVNVYIQGSYKTVTNTTPVFLTVHDIGTNRKAFVRTVHGHALMMQSCGDACQTRSGTS